MIVFSISKTSEKTKVFSKLFGKIAGMFFVTFLTFSVAYAQRTITGTVTDGSNESLPGVSIIVVGTSTGTVSNFDGTYSIYVSSDDAVLEYTFVGFRKQTITVGDQTVVNVVLFEDATELDELIVVGYGVQRRAHLTGSVSQVSSTELLKAPMHDVSNLLTGKLSGLSSIQRTGQPGADGAALYVRGTNSFVGNVSPLIIVDGVPRSMNFLNPNDIETISVLKDAAAAIYGIDGANGVILITTKRGNEGPAQISYSGSFSAIQNTAFPEFLSASEYMYWNNKARSMDGNTPLWNSAIQNKVMTNDPESIWGQTNWFDKIFRTGLMQQHNISASGGTDRVRYFTSVGMMTQDGTLKNTAFERYNIRTNLDIQVAKNLRFTTNLAGHRTQRNWPGTDHGIQSEFGPVRQAVTTIPVIKPEYEGLPTAWLAGSYYVNPYAALHESGYKRQTRFKIETSYQLEYDFSDLTDILKGLKFSVFAAYDYGQTMDNNYDRYYTLYSINSSFDERVVGASGYSPGNSFSKSSSYDETWMLRPQISYLREFAGSHIVGFTLLHEKRRGYSDTMTGRKRGYLADDPVDISMGVEYPTTGDIVSGSYVYSGQESYVGRINYAFAGKYLAEFALRRDGSFRFAPENRWGYFPSASVGWVVSQEDFFAGMSSVASVVDFLKIRASYGQAGKDEVVLNGQAQNFIYNSDIRIAQNNFVFGGNAISQLYTQNAYIVKDLTWETSHTYNVGIDANLLGGLLGVELDYFYTYTSDIIEQLAGNYPPSLASFHPSHANSGAVDNRGFEITLKHNNRINNDWRYNVRGSFSFARNKVLQRARTDNYPNYRAQVGVPLRARYGYEALGLFQTQEEIDQYPGAPSGFIRLGDLKYRDFNGDGRISSDHDYVKIGHGDIPEINFNFAADVSYKNFYLSMVWQGVSRCDYELSGIYDTGVTSSTIHTAAFSGGFGNTPKYLVEGAWTPENTNAKYPRLSAVSNGNNAWRSTWWVVNGQYLRLKNLNIGYNVPDEVLQRLPFSRVNVYLAGANLITLSHFKYIDPESPSVSMGYYPQQKTYSVGVNITF